MLFTPELLEVVVIQKVLQRSAPTVFINACRSAGFAATYNRLDGWATKFLEAGAAAFIGSLWAIPDRAAANSPRNSTASFGRDFHLGTPYYGPVRWRPASPMTPHGLPTPCMATRVPRSASGHDACEEDTVKFTDEGVPVDAPIGVVKDSLKRAGVSRSSQAIEARFPSG